jgi:hypothetical protein
MIIFNSQIRALPTTDERVAAYDAKVSAKGSDGRPRYQDTLEDRISAGVPLTDKQITALLEILGKRCRQVTKNTLSYALQAVPNVLNYGIFGRVMLDSDGASYCAGQSYPDEIRTVRKCLIG